MYNHNSEPVTIHRDVMATLIPDGYEIELPQGTGKLTLRALQIPGKQVMDFRLLILNRVD